MQILNIIKKKKKKAKKKCIYPLIFPLRISIACSYNVSNLSFGIISYILYTSLTSLAFLLHVGRNEFMIDSVIDI